LKIVAAFNRLIHQTESPTPAALAPFDDGLIELARLIEVEDPVEATDLETAER
jgi:hypothetical protein